VYQIYWVDKVVVDKAIGHRLAWHLIIILSLGYGFIDTVMVHAQTLPEDIPEEVLRTEIYTDARSPVDGKLLTAAEYIELNEQLEAVDIPARYLVSDKLQNLVQLLKLRKFIRQIVPFF